MPFTSNDDVVRYADWAAEDAERLAAELAAARKIVRLGKRHAVMVAGTKAWDAWIECPACQPWRPGDHTTHTCGLTEAERAEMARLDITKHGDKVEKLTNEIGALHRERMARS